ncbi:DUF7266 family protein [Halobellus rufus]|uniref:DUF7266 family protein n=1 Tax=Halobellus rufus TaxID=1448860 RepID=UPI0006799035|nr:hypothetical protein [Halobellus rufus]
MSRPDRRSAKRHDRGLSPVVGKTLELGVGVLFVALLTATLFGGLAPEYRGAVGSELGDRALVAAAERTEAATPDGDVVDPADPAATGGLVDVERRVTLRLPAAIRGDPYRIVAGSTGAASTLTLVHPDAGIGGRVRLAVPSAATVEGSVSSASPSRILVDGDGGGIVVVLVDGDDDEVDGGSADPPEATP